MRGPRTIAGGLIICQTQSVVRICSRSVKGQPSWFRPAWLQLGDESIKQAAMEIVRNSGEYFGLASTAGGVSDGSRGAPLEGSLKDRRSSAMISMEARWRSVVTRGQDGEATQTADEKNSNRSAVGRLLVEDTGENGIPSW